MRKLKGNTILIVLVAVFAVVAIVATTVAIYFWHKSKNAEQNNAENTTEESATLSEELTPDEVVQTFMYSTLGTLPGAGIDYDLARSYMTDGLKSQYSGDSWVPDFYGIQDGPTSVKFISENISGDLATVRYDPSWGEMGLGWAFILENVDGQWLISEFRNDAQ